MTGTDMMENICSYLKVEDLANLEQTCKNKSTVKQKELIFGRTQLKGFLENFSTYFFKMHIKQSKTLLNNTLKTMRSMSASG